MTGFIDQLQKDPEYYQIFLEEASSRGLYDSASTRTQTLQYSRKEYSGSTLERKDDRKTRLEDYVLYEEEKLTREERFQRHINKYLDYYEKKELNINYAPR